MIRAGTSYSTHRDPEKAAEEAARGALTKAGIVKADHVLVFISSAFQLQFENLLRIVRRVTQTDSLVGTAGSGVLTEEAEIESEHAVAVMALAGEGLDAHSFLIPNLQESSFRTGEKLGEQFRRWGNTPQMVLTLPDPYSFQSHLFFDGFENQYGYAPMVGGGAAECGDTQKTFQFFGNHAGFDSLAGVAFGGSVRAEFGITRSCQPFGEPFQVTRAEGNMIYEMDGRPAYDILLESISKLDVQNSDQLFQRVFLGVPMRTFQTDFSSAPYLIRNIMSANAKKGHLTCMTPVEEGEFITFTVRDAELARRDMENMLDELAFKIFPSKPAFGFYFNCCARGRMLYGESGQDIQTIRRHFPDVPIAGFFSFGEIAPIDHVNHFHHHSGILAFVVNNS